MKPGPAAAFSWSSSDSSSGTSSPLTVPSSTVATRVFREEDAFLDFGGATGFDFEGAALFAVVAGLALFGGGVFLGGSLGLKEAFVILRGGGLCASSSSLRLTRVGVVALALVDRDEWCLVGVEDRRSGSMEVFLRDRAGPEPFSSAEEGSGSGELTMVRFRGGIGEDWGVVLCKKWSRRGSD